MTMYLEGSDMLLNVGCGSKILPHPWVNIDAVEREGCKPDIVCDITQGIPLPDGSAAKVMAIHLVEHFYAWDLPPILDDWKRLLHTGGELIIECPNILKCAQNLIDGRMKAGKHPDQLTLWGLYGDSRSKDPYMCHRWGYTPASLGALLKGIGFIKVREERPQFHPVGKDHRDMRIVAVKP